MSLEADGLQLQAFSLSDVLGRKIVCEDKVTRRVESISYSQRYADKVLINEVNEDETPGGAWVHCLSLSCQMYKKPLPTIEQKQAFSRVMSKFSWQPDRGPKGEIKLPSGIILPQ